MIQRAPPSVSGAPSLPASTSIHVWCTESAGEHLPPCLAFRVFRQAPPSVFGAPSLLASTSLPFPVPRLFCGTASRSSSASPNFSTTLGYLRWVCWGNHTEHHVLGNRTWDHSEHRLLGDYTHRGPQRASHARGPRTGEHTASTQPPCNLQPPHSSPKSLHPPPLTTCSPSRTPLTTCSPSRSPSQSVAPQGPLTAHL